ncbi:MAG TPA: transcription repressor NadR [Lachnospiraceae bacterium]|nr:transcription repressor NadR [Lachnospiraceae bacterium]
MNAEMRRSKITEILKAAGTPVSASCLAAQLNVSRQIIVGDVALLRARGAEVSATPRGYLMQPADSRYTHRIACRHGAGAMQAELYAIVDEGCTVIDVIVEHPVYGQLTGLLQLSSRHDVDEFIISCRRLDAQPLSCLTEGIHLHTLSCPDEAAFRRVEKSLTKLHLLL